MRMRDGEKCAPLLLLGHSLDTLQCFSEDHGGIMPVLTTIMINSRKPPCVGFSPLDLLFLLPHVDSGDYFLKYAACPQIVVLSRGEFGSRHLYFHIQSVLFKFLLAVDRP